MTIDKLEPRVEKLTEQIRNLNFQFKDADLQQEAEKSKDEAIELLEDWLDLATQDWENRPESSDEDAEETP